MLVTKELSNFVNIVFLGNSVKNIKKTRILKVSVGYFAIIVDIKRVKDSHYHCVCISILEFWCRLQKLKSWMCVQ
jgi:hypothetical protein